TAATSNHRWFSREACDRWWGVRMLGSIHNEKSRRRCNVPLKGRVFFFSCKFRLLSRDHKSSEQFTYFNRRYHDEGLVKPFGNRTLNEVLRRLKRRRLGG